MKIEKVKYAEILNIAYKCFFEKITRKKVSEMYSIT